MLWRGRLSWVDFDLVLVVVSPPPLVKLLISLVCTTTKKGRVIKSF
jgi:hypothetical protein